MEGRSLENKKAHVSSDIAPLSDKCLSSCSSNRIATHLVPHGTPLQESEDLILLSWRLRSGSTYTYFPGDTYPGI